MATTITTQTQTPLAVSAQSAYELFLLEGERAYQKEALLYADYLDGEQDVYLTDRMQEFLGTGEDGARPKFRLNVCKTVIRAVVERLHLTGFDINVPATLTAADNAGDAGEDNAAADPSAAAWDWYNASGLAVLSEDIYNQTLATREHFLIIDWDAENMRPRATPAPRYIDTEAGGDGFGCLAVYENDDPEGGALLYVIKRWRENITDERGVTSARQRMTIYFPNRVERWVTNKLAQWEHFIEGEDIESWRVWWTEDGTQTGKPLGCAAIHFRNVGGASDLSDVVPLQDLINKVLVDLAASGDLAAFRIYKAFGMNVTTDGKPLAEDKSNQLLISPAAVVGNAGKSPSEASFDVIEGTDLSTLIELLKSLLVWLAMVTDVPLSRLQVTGQIASEKTLQGQELPLISKVESRQRVLGAAWASAFNLMLKLWNIYNKAESFEAGITFVPQWRDAKILSDAEKITGAATLAEKLKVPLEMAWRKSGQFSETEITQMLKSAEFKAMLRALEQGAAMGGGFGVADTTGAAAVEG